MAFIIKNVRDHVVHVDGIPMNPGAILIVRHEMTGPISKALDAGDVQLDDGDEVREGIHAVVEPVAGEATQEI